MIYTSDELIRLIHQTGALSIWNRQKGPVFWYIAGVPGPFYLNTEIMLGEELAGRLLDGIDGILAEAADPAARVARLETLILPAWEKNPVYRRLTDTMVARAASPMPPSDYSFVSGGERRDWLFSIPFAREAGKKHVFLFKDKSAFCPQGLKPPEAGLHIADLINNAASYFEAWFPALQAARLKCLGTVCVNSRGERGVRKLREHGQKVVSLAHIDADFFRRSLDNGLIDRAAYDEVELYMRAPADWAARHLIGRTDLFDVAGIDQKSFARLQSFFAKDPWHLAKDHAAFFEAMRTAIAAREANQAA
ncbi:MAG TPA: hypothetical protein VMV79_00775 [Alphaproteobacteria bacterium]|nr:hypothetical protein [Alphaproteobacteria bacterium]